MPAFLSSSLSLPSCASSTPLFPLLLHLELRASSQQSLLLAISTISTLDFLYFSWSSPFDRGQGAIFRMIQIHVLRFTHPLALAQTYRRKMVSRIGWVEGIWDPAVDHVFRHLANCMTKVLSSENWSCSPLLPDFSVLVFQLECILFVERTENVTLLRLLGTTVRLTSIRSTL